MKRHNRLSQALFAVGLSALSVTASAWQLSQEEENGQTYLSVSNDQQIENSQAYVVWFNMDQKENNIKSLSANGKWQEGIHPVVDTAFKEITPFSSQRLAMLDLQCGKEERCFVALVAVAEGEDPLNTEAWKATTLLPLTSKAAQERLYGQQFFLPKTVSNTGANFANSASGAATTATASPTAATDEGKTSDSSTATTTTEKPDIFVKLGSQLWYANSAAQKLQVIDVSDVNKPTLLAQTKLKGQPTEVYSLNDSIILLQNEYDGVAGTTLTVVKRNGNELVTTQTIPLTGSFLQSRRRNDVIYTVTQEWKPVQTVSSTGASLLPCDYCGSYSQLTVTAFRFANGQLTKEQSEMAFGYSPQIAIYPNHLLIASQNPDKWNSTLLQIYDLADGKALSARPNLTLAGRVPSEFHMNVQDNYLRVVFGPEQVGTSGSTLAVYDLTTFEPKLVGQVDKIAPTEDLFATRFTTDKAYVVTYERKDPLWVIDLSVPSAPKIVGELQVPGWSEKMFFNDNKLFAVGIHDQPETGEKFSSVRRVALSLFDVENPANPTLINRLVPLVGQASWSYSPALDDERALLLDWQQNYAALPISSWDSSSNNYLQITTMQGGTLQDAGLLETPIPLQRSLELGDNQLAGLGNQSLLTIGWGNGQKPKVLAELELAANLYWITQQGSDLLTASFGDSGYYRFYRYQSDNLESATQKWDLPRQYNAIASDTYSATPKVVFYNYNPLGLQVLDLTSGKLYPAQALEQQSTSTDVSTDSSYWYNRQYGMVRDSTFYVAEQMYSYSGCPADMMCIQMYPYMYQSQWTLRSWTLDNGVATEQAKRSIPSEPIMVTSQHQVVTRESSENGNLRLNLLNLTPSSAKLVTSSEIPCNYYNAQVQSSGDELYVNCNTGSPIYYPMYTKADVVDDLASSSTTTTASTVLYQISPNAGLTTAQSWKFEGNHSLAKVENGLAMMSENNYATYYPYTMTADIAIDRSMMMPYYSSKCTVYNLASTSPVAVKTMDTYCPSEQNSVLTPNSVVTTQGFEGLEKTTW